MLRNFSNEKTLMAPQKSSSRLCPPKASFQLRHPKVQLCICACHNPDEDLFPARNHKADISNSKPKSNSRITAIHHTQLFALSIITMYALINLRRPDTKRNKNLTPNNIGLYDSRTILINNGQEHRLKASKEITAKVLLL